MTKLTVKRYSIMDGDRTAIFVGNDRSLLIERIERKTGCPWRSLYEVWGYYIRDNHAVIEKLAEKAKNN